MHREHRIQADERRNDKEEKRPGPQLLRNALHRACRARGEAAYVDADYNFDGYAHSFGDSYGDFDLDTNADTNRRRHSQTNRDGNSDRNSYHHRYSNSYVYRANSYSHPLAGRAPGRRR